MTRPPLPKGGIGAGVGVKSIHPDLQANRAEAATALTIPGDPEAVAASSSRDELEVVTKEWIRNVYGAWLRIESPITRGFPDVIGTNGDSVAFVECKHLLHRPRGKTALGCRRNQLSFLATWPNSWLFVLIQSQYILINGKSLKPALMDYNELLDEAHLHFYRDRVDWELIGREIWA